MRTEFQVPSWPHVPSLYARWPAGPRACPGATQSHGQGCDQQLQLPYLPPVPVLCPRIPRHRRPPAGGTSVPLGVGGADLDSRQDLRLRGLRQGFAPLAPQVGITWELWKIPIPRPQPNVTPSASPRLHPGRQHFVFKLPGDSSGPAKWRTRCCPFSMRHVIWGKKI